MARLTERLAVVFEEVGGAQLGLTVVAEEVLVVPLALQSRDHLRKERKPLLFFAWVCR